MVGVPYFYGIAISIITNRGAGTERKGRQSSTTSICTFEMKIAADICDARQVQRLEIVGVQYSQIIANGGAGTERKGRQWSTTSRCTTETKPATDRCDARQVQRLEIVGVEYRQISANGGAGTERKGRQRITIYVQISKKCTLEIQFATDRCDAREVQRLEILGVPYGQTTANGGAGTERKGRQCSTT